MISERELKFVDLQSKAKRDMIPDVPGFYKVLLPKGFPVLIAKHTCAIERFTKKRKDGSTYEVVNQCEPSELENIWANLERNGALDDRVIYIGKGLHIRDRLDQYQRVMFKNGKNHSGGVYICQIENCSELEVEWYEYKSDAVIEFLKLPREKQKKTHPLGKIVNAELEDEEHRMIREYKDSHGDLRPFANRKD